MDAIMSLLQDFDFAALVPDLNTFLGRMELLARLAVLLGPLFLLGYGLWKLFVTQDSGKTVILPFVCNTKNNEAGDFARRLTGLLWGGLGAALLLVMAIVSIFFKGEQGLKMAQAVLICVIIELVLFLASWVVLHVLVRKQYEKDGTKIK